MADLRTFVVKDADTIRADIKRTIRNGLIELGVNDPNVSATSDFDGIALALGNELTVIGANCVLKCDAQMPDTAQDEDLMRITDIFSLSPQEAAGSLGSVVIAATQTSPIPTGAELIDEQGQRFRVTIGGNYADGAEVPIEAISVGYSTNHDEGDVLTWASAPAYCSDKVTVASGGLTNGADAEDNEILRQRLFGKFQNPSGSANPAHVIEALESSTNSVQKAFAYPAVQGPSTCDGVVCAAPTATNKSRQIATALLDGTVRPYADGALPRFGLLTITTVADVSADVAIGLSLPEAPTANPPGPGGGWLNGTPWPSVDASTTFRCTVTAVTSTKMFVVDATASPTAGVSQIAWLSPYDWTLYSATVLAVSGTTGAYTITLDKPFVGITTGCYIWPNCQNAQAYVDALLQSFAKMGPGEKTSNASALVRGFRHPPPANAWPCALGPSMLNDLTVDDLEEVEAAQFLHRYDGTTTITGSAGQLAPQVPTAIANAPKIFVPRHLAFYRIP